MPFTRQTAIPISAIELKEGGFLHEQGLSGIATPRGLAQRASIIGIAVEKTDDLLLLDDGTGSIRVQRIDNRPLAGTIGDTVLAIGTPQEHDGERYLAMEISKKLDSRNWLNYRKRELRMLEEELLPNKSVAAPAEMKATPKPEQNPLMQIVNIIRELDDGSGAQTHDVLERINDPNKERLYRILLEEGEIFEVRPGRVKVLE